MAYLEEELAGLNSVPNVASDPRVQHTLAMLSQSVGLLTPEEISRQAQELNDKLVREKADKALVTGDQFMLENLAERYQRQPTRADLDDVVVNELSRGETATRLATLNERSNRFRVEQEYNKQQALSAIRGVQDELKESRSKNTELLGTGRNLVNNAAYTLTTVAQWADTNLLPGFYAEVINAIKAVAPDIVSNTDYLQPADAIKLLSKRIRDSSPEESQKIVEAFLGAAHNGAGRLMASSSVGEAQILQELADGIEQGELLGVSVTGLSDVFAPLDYIGGAALAKSAISTAAKALTQFGKGTVASTAARYGAGARSLVEGVGVPGLNAARGTDDAQVLGALALPKNPGVTGEAAPSGLPFYDNLYLSATDRAKKAADVLANEQSVATATYQQRFLDSTIEEVEGGLQTSILIGDVGRTGFATEAEALAEIASDASLTGGKVIKDALGAYQIKIDKFHKYSYDDFGARVLDPNINIGVGKGSKFDEQLVQGSGAAVKNNAKLLAENQRFVQSFNKLKGQASLRVQSALENAEKLKQTDAQARLALQVAGAGGDELKAFDDIRALAQHNYSVRNANAHEITDAAGYLRALDIDGGTHLYKDVPAGQFGSVKINPNVRAVDLYSNTKVDLASVDLTQYRVVEFFENTASGYQYGVIKNGLKLKDQQKPVNLLRRIEGYLPRKAVAPYYVKETQADGQVVTLFTARSELAASRKAKQLAVKYPSRSFAPVAAKEIGEVATNLDDIARLRASGELFNSSRKLNPLKDAEGGNTLISIPDAIQTLAGNTAAQESLVRWTIGMKQAFDKTYGDVSQLGWKLSAAEPPMRSSIPLEKIKLYEQGLKEYNWIRRVNGIESDQGAGQAVRVFAGKVADLFYNSGTLARGIPLGNELVGAGVGAVGGAVGEYNVTGTLDEGTLLAAGAGALFGFGLGYNTVSKFLGDNLSGLDSSAIRAAKTAAFTSYIALNPHVHAVLQAANIPTYLGVRHAAPYLLSGRYFSDSLILQFANDVGKLDTLRVKLGLDSKYIQTLLKDYRDSGLGALVKQHIDLLGTIGDSRVVGSGAVRDSAKSVFNFAKAIGNDVGVSADKRAAWLMMRNRAIGDGKKLDLINLKTIAQEAEQLTGSLNSSDPLYNTNGLLSVFAQFASYPIKFANRLLGGTVGAAVDAATGGKVRISAEQGLSRLEQARIVGIAALTYGTAGFGATELIERWNNKYKWELTQTAKDVLKEGLIGEMFNITFGLAANGGEPDQLVSFASRLGPFAGPSRLIDNVVQATRLMLSAKYNQALEFFPSPVGLGLGADMYEVAKFAWSLGGRTELPGDDIALLTAVEFMKKFPITNEALKYTMASNLGYKFDSKGNPTVAVGQKAALAALWGVNTYDELAAQSLNKYLYGNFTPLDDKGLIDAFDAQVVSTLKWLEPVLNGDDGAISATEAYKLINSHNITMQTTLKPEQYALYRDRLAAAILKKLNGNNKLDKLLDTYAKQIVTGRVPVTESLIDKLRGLGLPNIDAIIPVLESLHKAQGGEDGNN